MRNKILMLLTLLGLFCVVAQADEIVYLDDFEAYDLEFSADFSLVRDKC